MKRHHLLLLFMVAAGALVFGASTALASGAGGYLDFNPQTGEMSYKTGDTTPFADGHDEVWVVHTGIQNYPISLQPAGFQNGIPHSSNVTTYCVDHKVYGWICPAAKVSVTTNKGDDTIQVEPEVTLPTVLEGGPGADQITGGGGNDQIWGACKNLDPSCANAVDTLHGGGGNDLVHGGNYAFDHLYGDAGDDLLDGGLGTDELFGGDGTDLADYSARTTGITASLDGVAYNDGAPGEGDWIHTDIEGIQGGSGYDNLYGNDSANVLDGGPGGDYIDARGGDDVLKGGSGNDLLRPGFGSDKVYGGSDLPGSCCKFDTVTYGERWNPVYVSLDGVANDGELGENDFVASDVENISGGESNDTLVGNQYANMLVGGWGTDSLDGKGGGGQLESPQFAGSDTLDGGLGNDALNGGPPWSVPDFIDGGAGTDTISYASRTDGVKVSLDGSQNGEDVVTNVENAFGGAGADTLVGNEGPNALYGNGGYDTLSGGGGGDYMSGSAGADTVTYADHTAPVNVSLDGWSNDGVSGEGDNVVPDVETIVGGQAGDTLVGDVNANTLVGGPGPDTLYGLDGSDTLDGGDENDQLLGGPGVDVLRGGPGADQLKGGNDADVADYSSAPSGVVVNLGTGTASGGAGSDTLTGVENLYGSSYADMLTGDGSSNRILAGAGPDTLLGGAGNDHLFGAAGNDVIRGGAGDDEIDGGSDNDTVDYSSAASGITVDLSSYNGTAVGGGGSDWLMGIENVLGSPYPDSIKGSSIPNVLKGGAGDDTLSSLGGNDFLDGQAGLDTLDGGAEIDTCLGETLANCEK